MNDNQPNPHQLLIVLMALDAKGMPRISMDEVLTCGKEGKPARAYVTCRSLHFDATSLTRFVPEAALHPERYDLDDVLRHLKQLELQDDVLTAYLLYLLDYGRKDSPMLEHLDFVVDYIEDQEEEVTLTQRISAAHWLIRKAARIYPLDTRDYKQELRERAEWMAHLTNVQLIEREKLINKERFTAVFEVDDPAGHPRPWLPSIYRVMNKALKIKQKYNTDKVDFKLSGFVDNPYTEMHSCVYLLQVPEWCLAGDCDLPLLWALLVKWKVTKNHKDTLLLVHAADWGRRTNECMAILQRLGKGFTPDNAYIYVVRQLEAKAIENGKLLAGGKANNQIVKEVLKGQERRR